MADATVTCEFEAGFWIQRQSGIPRYGMPEDFDSALLFLASEGSACTPGRTLRVDGHWTAH